MLRELDIFELELVSGGCDLPGDDCPSNDNVFQENQGRRFRSDDDLYRNDSGRGSPCSSCHTPSEFNEGSQFFTANGGSSNIFVAVGDAFDNIGTHVGHAVAGMVEVLTRADTGNSAEGRRSRQENRHSDRN